MIDWQVDQEMTKAVECVFADHKPTVRHLNGQQYLLDHTPYGTVEIFPIDQEGKYLVAAEHPPAQLRTTKVPEYILAHLSKHRLRPWRYQHASTVLEVVYSLNSSEQVDPATKWSPYAMEVPSPPQHIIGEHRQQRVHTIEALIRAAHPGGPVTALSGPRGVGKHTLTAALARQLNLQAVEIPLFRLLIPRVLKTGLEALMESLVEWTQQEDEQVLVVLSDAELVEKVLPSTYRRLVIQELSRIPYVLLLSNATEPLPIPLTAQVRCEGLRSVDELKSLLKNAVDMGKLPLADSALKLLQRTSQHPEFGILPGRALHALRLSQLLKQGNRKNKSKVLSPDDVMPALAWAGEMCEESSSDSD